LTRKKGQAQEQQKHDVRPQEKGGETKKEAKRKSRRKLKRSLVGKGWKTGQKGTAEDSERSKKKKGLPARFRGKKHSRVPKRGGGSSDDQKRGAVRATPLQKGGNGLSRKNFHFMRVEGGSPEGEKRGETYHHIREAFIAKKRDRDQQGRFFSYREN